MGACNGERVLVNAEELGQWPASAVAAMKSQRLLMKARPAVSVVCPGCEQACVMAVHTMPDGPHGTTSFTICDKRSDINRVAVSNDRLTQWRCDADAVCGFVGGSLDLRLSDQPPADGGLRNIGMARGGKRSQMLCLRADGGLSLVAGSNAMPLIEMVGFRDGAFSVDAVMVRQLVDAATTADARHTPSNAKREARKLDTQAMYASWQKAYRDLKKERRGKSDVWCSQQIAKQPIAMGRNAETIRKHMLT